MAPDGETYVAVVPPGTGPVYVDYQTSRLPADFTKVKPTREMIGKDMPPAWSHQQLETVFVTPESSPSEQRTASFKGVLPGASKSLDFTGSVTVQQVPGYVPSQADLAKAARSGVPVYGLELTPVKGDNGDLTITVSGYLEQEVLDRLGREGALQAMLGGPAAVREKDVTSRVQALGVKDFVKVGYRFAVKKLGHLVEPAESLWEKFEQIKDLEEGYGLKDIFEELGKLEELLRYVEEHCGPADTQRFMWQIDRLVTDMIILEVSKALLELTLAGVAYLTGVVTFGLSIATFIAMDIALDYALEAAFDTEIEEVRNEIDRVCRKENKKADPVWIHDPSGYVYEVEPSNRIPGIQATVLHKNEDTGSWEVWDAEWFEQVNPQITDGEGRYGWFVPDGLWKVIYEGAGFVTTESAELQVLPPHFDVNIPMVSTLPSRVTHIRPAPGGGYVDVWFDRHVRMETANGYTVSLSSQGSRWPGGSRPWSRWTGTGSLWRGKLDLSPMRRWNPDGNTSCASREGSNPTTGWQRETMW
ncbi:hypothetical protein N6H14_09170 [Paenibacillus sp. CC-CFT747]|nr:hypothetical protein N6H14_09170 [Paenibacillus sp. CC-CFT747]